MGVIAVNSGCSMITVIDDISTAGNETKYEGIVLDYLTETYSEEFEIIEVSEQKGGGFSKFGIPDTAVGYNYRVSPIEHKEFIFDVNTNALGNVKYDTYAKTVITKCIGEELVEYLNKEGIRNADIEESLIYFPEILVTDIPEGSTYKDFTPLFYAELTEGKIEDVSYTLTIKGDDYSQEDIDSILSKVNLFVLTYPVKSYNIKVYVKLNNSDGTSNSYEIKNAG